MTSVSLYGLVKGDIAGPKHFSTAPRIMERILETYSTPNNPVGIDDIALLAGPNGAYVKSPILVELLG